jgi:hypothetical protein
MIRHTRGEQVTFFNTFYDVDGNVATVASATLTVVYPNSTSASSLLARDPGQPKGKQTIAMTVDADTQEWSAVWDSGVSDPGTVYWNMKSPTPGASSEDGAFVVEGNMANLEAF